MDQESFIKELGRSYIVSSLLPAALFCLILLLLFQGFIPIDYFAQVEKTNLVILGQWLLMSIVPIWIGFFLFSSVDWVVKLYEGYYLPEIVKKPLREIQKKRWQKSTKSYQTLNSILEKDLKERTDEENEKFDNTRDDAFLELQSIEIELPSEESNLMPTRLGNVLKASEVYALDRYLIESVTIWPRLFPVLPGKFLNDMEEKNNHFMFLLNSSLVMYLAGGLSMIAGIGGHYFLSSPEAPLVMFMRTYISLPNGFKTISPLIYLVFSLVLLTFGYILYRVAVYAAEDFSLFYRAGFDLYRMDLLRQLNYELPANRGEEKNLWFDISSFFAVGDKLVRDLENFEYPAYHHYQVEKPQEEKKN